MSTLHEIKEGIANSGTNSYSPGLNPDAKPSTTVLECL